MVVDDMPGDGEVEEYEQVDEDDDNDEGEEEEKNDDEPMIGLIKRLLNVGVIVVNEFEVEKPFPPTLANDLVVVSIASKIAIDIGIFDRSSSILCVNIYWLGVNRNRNLVIGIEWNSSIGLPFVVPESLSLYSLVPNCMVRFPMTTGHDQQNLNH